MGGSGADFGAVSTAGLIERVRRRAVKDKAEIGTSRRLTRSRKRGLVDLIDHQLARIELAWAEVQAGRADETKLREALVAILDPRMAGGRRSTYFGW